MRQLDDFKYLATYINDLIDSKLQDMRSQFVKIKKTDGVFCDCELVKSQKDITEFKNVPIIQSGRFHYSTKDGDLGLLINTGQIPAELFTTGTMKGPTLDIPFYLFLPLQTKLDGVKNQLKKDNVIIEDSEKTNTLKLDQQGVDLKTGKELKVTSGGNITIDGGSNNVEIKASGGIKLEGKSMIDMSGTALILNEAEIGQILQDLFDAIVQGLQTASGIPVPMNGNWSAGWSAGKPVAEGAWKPKLEAFKQKIK